MDLFFGYRIDIKNYLSFQEIFGEYFPYGIRNGITFSMENDLSIKDQKTENHLLYKIFCHTNLSRFLITNIINYYLRDKYQYAIFCELIDQEKYQIISPDDRKIKEILNTNLSRCFLEEFLKNLKSQYPKFELLEILDLGYNNIDQNGNLQKYKSRSYGIGFRSSKRDQSKNRIVYDLKKILPYIGTPVEIYFLIPRDIFYYCKD